MMPGTGPKIHEISPKVKQNTGKPIGAYINSENVRYQ